ncbi:MAG: ComEC/Rec2 family competence protein [Treponema sp.]|jgi:competence protein ComEC|nr:ComEC/Rec2 family competence protein [Treponema sp.]
MITPAFCAAVGAAVGYYSRAFLPSSILTGCVTGFLLLYPGLTGAAQALFIVSRSKRNSAFILLLSSAAIGLFAGLAAGKTVSPSSGLSLEKISAVSGTLMDDPRSYSARYRAQAVATLSLSRAQERGKAEVSARGDVLVFFPEGAAPRLKAFGRGCEVHIDGGFIAERRNGALLFFAKSTHIIKPAPRIEQFRTGLRMSLAERFSQFAWGGLGLALLFGMKDDLDPTLSLRYQRAGCSHVLALSGMHLAVVSATLAFFLKKPLGLRGAAAAGACFIIAYTYLAGNLPSLNRAALMYLLGTLTVLFNLPKDTLSILAMTFVLQIVLYRREGMSVSFILSYLALFGILVLSKPIYGFFRGWTPDPLGRSLSASLAAFLCTAAASSAFFSTLYPIGVIAGLVIVPLTTLFMIGAMLAMAASFLPFPLPPFISLPLSFLYAIINRVITWASLPPPLPTPNTALVLSASLAFTAFILFMDRRSRRRRLEERVQPRVYIHKKGRGGLLRRERGGARKRAAHERRVEPQQWSTAWALAFSRRHTSIMPFFMIKRGL